MKQFFLKSIVIFGVFILFYSSTYLWKATKLEDIHKEHRLGSELQDLLRENSTTTQIIEGTNKSASIAGNICTYRKISLSGV